MNRIYTLVIASTLILTGSSVFAQQLPRSIRPAQQTEVIQYAIERASEVPSYRGHRKSNVYVAPKSARTVVQRTYPNVKKQSSLALSPLSPRQTIEAAPVIYGSSRRGTRIAVPTPATEVVVSAHDPFELVETKIDVVRTSGQSRPKLIHINEAITLSSPVEQPKTTEAAPVIYSSSRRLTRIAVPTPVTEIAISAPDPIKPAETQSDVVRITTPAKASPNFEYRSPSDYDSEDLQLSKWQPQPKQLQSEEAIALSSPVEQPKTTEAAPVIPSSSRRITNTTVPEPEIEIAISAPDSIEPAEIQSDVVRTETPAASPNFKHRSPSDYGREELQQSQWQPQPKQVQSAEAIAISSPDEEPWTIDLTDPFETVAPAVSADNKTAAIPLKSALLGSEEESPFTSFIAKTDRRPAVETGYTTEAVGPIAFATSATAGLTTKADTELQTAKTVHTSAEGKSSHQKTADIAWWAGLTLLAVPFLALLGWSIFGPEKHQQFEEAPVIEIPLQSNTPWKFQESSDAQLSLPFASETDPQEIHCSGEETVALGSETELLDEIHSINAIAFNSNSAARSTLNDRAESKNN